MVTTAILALTGLADRLRAAAARHGLDGPVIPLTALATVTLLLGAREALWAGFLCRLAHPAHALDTRRVWQAAACEYPYLPDRIGPLTRVVRRSGRYGDFLGCSNYPRCTQTMRVAAGRSEARRAAAFEAIAHIDRRSALVFGTW